MTTNDIKSLTKIETAICSRCYGSGNYSFNTMYGTMCFGCHGKGHKITKRGAVARAFIDALRYKSVPVTSLQVGDTYLCDNGTKKVHRTITAIDLTPVFSGCKSMNFETKEWVSHYDITVTTATGEHRLNEKSTVKVRMPISDEDSFSQGLQLQATLNKAGKPTKATTLGRSFVEGYWIAKENK